MKTVTLIIVPLCLFLSRAYTQATITVDVSQRVKTLNGRENGINVDYLMDGGFTNPATPTATALKNMGIKMLRYPGGEKSDNYLWSAAPWTAASPRMALLDTVNAWPTRDSQFVDMASPEKRCKSIVMDFDELMNVSRETGAAPLIVVAYDAMYNIKTTVRPTKQQLLTNAVEWVRYANVTKKFGVKYWMIGNESWNLPDYNGRTTATQYATDLLDFAKAMKAVDPTIKIIANGITSWWPTLLQSPAVGYIDMLAFSFYPVLNYTNGYESYRTSTGNFTTEIDNATKAINTYAPVADRARLKLLVAEYNSIDYNGGWSNENNLGHALCNFQLFGDVVVNPKVESACSWTTRWVTNLTEEQHLFDALDKSGNLNASGIAQQVWGQNLLNTMVTALSGDAQVKVYASYDTATRNLNLFLLNKDLAAKTVKVSLANYGQNYSGARYVFSGTTVSDKFPTFLRTDTILNAAALSKVTLAPASVTVLKLAATPEVPATVVSFTGNIVTDNVLLNWEIQNDTSLLYYSVEKGLVNNNFAAVGLVNVRDHASTNASYSYLDTTFVADVSNYYRLKLVGRNGKTAYSGVLEMRAPADSSAFAVVIAPNPVRNELQLQLRSSAAQQITVQIIDAQGRIWSSEKVQVQAGATSQTLRNLQGLHSGIYWLRVATGRKHTTTVPFLKQ